MLNAENKKTLKLNSNLFKTIVACTFIVCTVLLLIVNGQHEIEEPADNIPLVYEQPSSEGSIPENATVTPPIKNNENRFVHIKDALEEYFAENLLGENTQSILSEQGISAIAKNVEMKSDRDFSFMLVLSDTEGNKREYRMNGYCAYNNNYITDKYSSYDDPFWGSNVEWGGVSIVSSSLLAVCSLSDITLLEMNDLSEANYSLELDALKPRGKPLGIRYDPKFGYVTVFLPYGEETEPYLAFFNESGHFLKTENLLAPGESYSDGVTSPWKYTFFTHWGVVNHDTVSIFCPDMFILDTQPMLFIFQNNISGTLIYNVLTNETVYAGRLLITSSRGRYAAAYGVAGLEYTDEYLALYRDKNDDQKHFFFSGDIHPYYNDYWLDEKKWEDTIPVISGISSLASLTLILDYDNEIATLVYDIKPEDLEQYTHKGFGAVSPDGQYSLLLSNSSFRDRSEGVGDWWGGNVVLQNNRTGTLNFVTSFGGMWGGLVSVGFFGNDEIYVLDYECLKLFSISDNGFPQQKAFAAEIGSIEEQGYWRFILAVERKQNTYIALYTERPFDDNWSYEGDLPYKLNFNYKIGFFDKSGILLKGYDTGEPVLFDGISMTPTSLSLSGNELTIFYSIYDHERNDGIYDVFRLGTFNLESCIFTPEVT